MTPERHRQIMDVFDAVVALPGAERAAALRVAREEDADLAQEVQSLLEWDTAGYSAENEARPAPPPAGGLTAQDLRVLGPYEILDVLGRGGMAVVYRARQQQPDRIVALKVIHSDAEDSTLHRRFQREIKLLAGLRHPGIAAIYDAGSIHTERGHTDYFAMELVDGKPLTAFAKARRLSVRQRVQLLLSVCDALAHAHQRGVIHRDLKPGNILVEDRGAFGAPRILDFGIARMLDAGDSGGDVTREHHVIGTLAYMCPEQLHPGATADTRCDVYALGVVGYELLAGRLPIELKPDASPLDALRAFERRGAKPLARHDSRFRGDLSLIFEKALSADPERRYPSVLALADDLRAWLERRPVQARPPSPMYQLGKFAQRNPVTVMLASVALLAVTGGGIGTSWGMLEARRAQIQLEAELAEATDTARFLVREIVASLDGVAGTAEIRQSLLARLLSQIESLRERDPDDVQLREDHAAVLTSYSDTFVSTDREAEALPLREAALQLRRELAAAEPENADRTAEVSIALVRVGDIHNGAGALQRAHEYYGHAYTLDQELVRRDPDSVWFLDNLAWSHDRLGCLAQRNGELAQAADHFQRRLALTHRLLELAPDRPATQHGLVVINGYLAELAERDGDPAAAENHLQAGYFAAERLAAQHPTHRLYTEVRLNAARKLGDFLLRIGKLEDAKAPLDVAAAVAARMTELDPLNAYPPRAHFSVLMARIRVAIALQEFEQADALLLRASHWVDAAPWREVTGCAPDAEHERITALRAEIAHASK